MDLVISTNSGCETWLIEELEEHGYGAKVLKPAKVRVRNCTPEDAVYLNLALRQAHRVFILLAEGEAQTLEDMKRLTKSINLSEHICPNQTFAIRGKREGKHAFTSVDIGREVGAAVIETYEQEKGVRLRVNLDEPDVEIHAELSGHTAHILLNTTGSALYNRYPRPFQHFAPLKPTIAATLVRVAKPKSGQFLLDPMAGGGTILAEAWMHMKGIAPCVFKERTYAFEKLKKFEGIDKEEVLNKVKERMQSKGSIKLMGADISPKNVRGMEENLAVLGVPCKTLIGDAKTMEYLSETPDLIITNPPYGLRVASKRAIQRLYYAFAKACAKRNVPKVVALTAEGKTLADAMRQAGYTVEMRHPMLYGKLWTDILLCLKEKET